MLVGSSSLSFFLFNSIFLLFLTLLILFSSLLLFLRCISDILKFPLFLLILSDSLSVKVRRQPKAMKPKKLIRLESKNVVYVACNNGSSAMVTKEGEVFMFGKDTTHCDHASGE